MVADSYSHKFFLLSLYFSYSHSFSFRKSRFEKENQFPTCEFVNFPPQHLDERERRNDVDEQAGENDCGHQRAHGLLLCSVSC
jgi:hypothetical protein